MIIISASRRNLDYASQAPLHPGYAGFSFYQNGVGAQPVENAILNTLRQDPFCSIVPNTS